MVVILIVTNCMLARQTTNARASKQVAASLFLSPTPVLFGKEGETSTWAGCNDQEELVLAFLQWLFFCFPHLLALVAAHLGREVWQAFLGLNLWVDSCCRRQRRETGAPARTEEMADKVGNKSMHQQLSREADREWGAGRECQEQYHAWQPDSCSSPARGDGLIAYSKLFSCLYCCTQEVEQKQLVAILTFTTWLHFFPFNPLPAAPWPVILPEEFWQNLSHLSNHSTVLVIWWEV